MLFYDYLTCDNSFFCYSFCIFAKSCIFESPTVSVNIENQYVEE